MADVSKIKASNGTEYTIKDNSQVRSNHRHYESDTIPLIHKTYASTSYYATTGGDYNTSTWYFMSVKPDAWYKPWTVKFKVHTFCPNYSSYDSYTYSTISGRSTDIIYANWNERYNSAHYYITIYPLKEAGFNAGYGHAIGVSIIWGDNYTNSNYYRTFEVEYYSCENCTVTMLDTPVLWSSWPGTGSTNYGSLGATNAVSRGLYESGDTDETAYYVRRIYSLVKAGSNKIFPYTIIMQTADDRWESIVTSNSTGTKSRNTHGFRLGQILLMNGGETFNENVVVANYRLWSMYSGLVDHRYSFNTANNATSGTVANSPVYIVGTLASDGLFYLDSTWWTQTLPTTADGKLYIYIGDAYDYYRMTFVDTQKIYHYVNGAIRVFSQDAGTVNGLSVQTAVPSGAKFTDTTYTLGTSGNNVTLTPSSGSAQSITVPYSTLSNAVYGIYTTNGGQQPPNYFGTNRAGFLMSNASVAGDSHYKNWLYMDNYNGSDVGGATAIGVDRTEPRMFIMQSDANRTSWNNTAAVGVFTATPTSGQVVVTDGTTGGVKSSGYTIATSVPSGAVFTDTKNTAGSTDTSSKIYLIGATSQAANPQTYSDNEVYATSGVLTTKSVQVGGGAASLVYNVNTMSIDFTFT